MNAPLMAAVGEINMNRKWNPEPPGLFKNLSNETHCYSRSLPMEFI